VSLGLGLSDVRALDALGWRAAAGAAHGRPVAFDAARGAGGGALLAGGRAGGRAGSHALLRGRCGVRATRGVDSGYLTLHATPCTLALPVARPG
jgi:hypothetical protein